MNRISIDVTPEQHQKLKAIAALQGKSIKQLILESTLGDGTSQALSELEAFLDKRIAEARSAGQTARTVDDIFDEARRKLADGQRNA